MTITPFSPTLIALAFTLVTAACVIAFLPPFWETNDDIGMSMIVDGYGTAEHPSPGLIFSNILYGYAITALPFIGDVSRYSLVSFSLNVLAIFCIARALSLLTGHQALALTTAALVAVQALASPQFTVLAGLLTVAGLLQCFLYLKSGKRRDIAAGGMLLLLGYLVRPPEFLLVVLVCAVALPWKRLVRDRVVLVAMSVVTLSIAAAAIADWLYYRQPEWSGFRRVNALQAMFSDYAAASYFRKDPGLLDGTGYTLNDINLLSNWWIVDPLIADPERLSALLSRVNPAAWAGDNMRLALAWIALLGTPPLLFVLAPAIVALLAARKLTLVVAALVFASVLIVFGLIGRYPVARVVYPLLVLLLCLGMLQIREPVFRIVLIGALVVAGVGAVDFNARRHREKALQSEIASAEVARLDRSRLYVDWAGAIPHEALYPVFGSLAQARQFRMFGLGSTALAPFAQLRWKDAPGGLPGRLQSGPPVAFFASRSLIESLSVYCAEHYSRRLQILNVHKLGIGEVYDVTCSEPVLRQG